METIEENYDNHININKKNINSTVDDEDNCEQEDYDISTQCVENLNENFVFNSPGTGKINNLNNAEEPMDLTFSQKNIKCELENIYNVQKKRLSDGQMVDEVKSNASIAIAKLVQADQLVLNTNAPKKRGRKRKEITIEINNGVSYTPSYDNPEFVQMDSRQGEVLMAAKSLFSKRTRTLYHWMYPNTPKTQLKTAVSMSWETLGIQEKEFYISQVLGRFGFPQSSLMVNPQLDGLRGAPILPPLDLSTPPHLNLETRTAVSTILDDRENSSEAGSSWTQYNYSNAKKNNKKRGRIGRPPGSKAQKLKENNVKSVTVENINEDFPDDPELRKEFEQFKWALHMSDE